MKRKLRLQGALRGGSQKRKLRLQGALCSVKSHGHEHVNPLSVRDGHTTTRGEHGPAVHPPEAEAVPGPGGAPAAAGPGQRRENHAAQAAGGRGHHPHHAHPGLQHQEHAVRRLQAERLGHRRAAEDPALLEELLREHGRADLRDRQLRQEEVRRDKFGALRAAGRRGAGRRAAADLRQQAGPADGLHGLGAGRVPPPAHHPGPHVAGAGLLGRHRRGSAGRHDLGLQEHFTSEEMTEEMTEELRSLVTRDL